MFKPQWTQYACMMQQREADNEIPTWILTKISCLRMEVHCDCLKKVLCVNRRSPQFSFSCYALITK